jgi:hypothetical protein
LLIREAGVDPRHVLPKTILEQMFEKDVDQRGLLMYHL